MLNNINLDKQRNKIYNLYDKSILTDNAIHCQNNVIKSDFDILNKIKRIFAFIFKLLIYLIKIIVFIKRIFIYILIAAIIIGVIYIINNPDILNNFFINILKQIGIYNTIIKLKNLF